MNDANQAPGRRLSQIRQAMGLSQRRVAELAGLTHSAISTIEQDKVSPAVSTLQKLLKVYGLSLSEFFSEPHSQDAPNVVVRPEDLLEIGSRGVSLKLIDNGTPKRDPGHAAGDLSSRCQYRGKTAPRGRRNRYAAGRSDRSGDKRPAIPPVCR
ncbi:HTH-type transcriptional regulator PuuR [Pantoea ananatis AJ13355]|uniref:HTH-type transcriptional regulator PuuR n=1 Tax=Pantoea ananatis (strain AJ13355) TaxID=932677 RepID=A0A0H3KXR1_PANAA|nr:HTH-type transcriptional regulator PuuR [Pantoea ananatis AJ13355]